MKCTHNVTPAMNVLNMYMYVMSRRALDKSSLLSLLLDDVVGTQMIRQDNRYVSYVISICVIIGT